MQNAQFAFDDRQTSLRPAAAPKILYINGRFLAQPLSGVQRFASQVTLALRQTAPGPVTVLGPPGADANDPEVQVVGHRGGQLWEQLELPRQVGGSVLMNLGNIAPLRLRAQIVVLHDASVFSVPEAYSIPFRLWYRYAHRRLVRSGARIATVSEFSRSELVRHLGVAPEDITVVSEGADHMDAVVADRDIFARLPPGRFVLAVGNLAVHKNLGALAELAARLAERGVSLVITGSLVGRSFRRPADKALPLPACYLGRVSDAALKALYQRAACLVFPSRYEGFGLPAVEAMACRCPVAAARIPALIETCADAATYFDPTSPADIATQVCRLLDDEILQAQLRNAGKLRAQRFTWARTAEQLIRLAEAMTKAERSAMA